MNQRHHATGAEDPKQAKGPAYPGRKKQRKDDQPKAVPAPQELKSTLPKYMADKGVEAYPSMPVQFGPLKATVFGGKFREWVPGQRRVVAVKMAAEVDHPHDISIPTEDYSTPKYSDMHKGLAKALEAIKNGNDLYVGCFGGIGRTGLFMACLAKTMFDFERESSQLHVGGKEVLEDPVRYVREHYNPHAVETPEQSQFVHNFSTSEHVAWLKAQTEPQVVRIPEVTVKTVERVVYHFNPFLALYQLFGGGKGGDLMPKKGPHES